MKISDSKRDKISEQILAFLYSLSMRPAFTSHIAREIARDEEFVKNLLLDLQKKSLVAEIRKNPRGEQYLKRSRWKLTNEAYLAYKKAENSQPGPVKKINQESDAYIKTD